MLIHVVADYGQGDLAFAEVIQRFASFPKPWANWCRARAVRR
jgi:hypothetical protein